VLFFQLSLKDKPHPGPHKTLSWTAAAAAACLTITPNHAQGGWLHTDGYQAN
jgi:hypothetical protein